MMTTDPNGERTPVDLPALTDAINRLTDALIGFADSLAAAMAPLVADAADRIVAAAALAVDSRNGTPGLMSLDQWIESFQADNREGIDRADFLADPAPLDPYDGRFPEDVYKDVIK